MAVFISGPFGKAVLSSVAAPRGPKTQLENAVGDRSLKMQFQHDGSGTVWNTYLGDGAPEILKPLAKRDAID
jgi:hypothetical protein